jgi:hypothetical protein
MYRASIFAAVPNRQEDSADGGARLWGGGDQNGDRCLGVFQVMYPTKLGVFKCIY